VTADRKRYDVEINGRTTTLRLSDEDAKARGLLGGKKAAEPEGVGVKVAPAPANKARSARAK
jgi:hypothetical protein